MKNRFRQVVANREAGFSMIEILGGIAIVVILGGIVTFAMLSQRDKAFDAAVRSDLQSAATAAQTYYVDAFEYPTEEADFGSDGVNPAASKGTSYSAFVYNTAGETGYVIYGLSQSGQLFELSSWTGNIPEKIDGSALPNSPETSSGAPTAGSPSNVTWAGSTD